MGDGPLNIMQIPGFENLWNEAVADVYERLSTTDTGACKIAVTIGISCGGVRLNGKEAITAYASVQVKAPSAAKIQTGLVELIRENGVLKAVPPVQTALGLGS